MSDNSIISVGDSYRLYGSEVKTHSDLPVGTYEIEFNPMAGYSLERVDDLTAEGERVYGNRQVKADKIIRSYKSMNRNLGVMLSGDKGQGKSLFVRMLADAARADNIPVIKVTKATPGIADFIDSLGECLVIFDEFEKVFRKGGSYEDGEQPDSQDQFLSVFDGTSSVNRIYCITFNNMYGVSNYMLNRPGRFHYHLRFDYPTIEEIETYLSENVEGVTEKQIEDVTRLSLRTNINYDHLRAISFEFKIADGGTRLGEFIDDLNIKPVEDERYRIEAHYKDGTILTDRDKVSIGDTHRLHFSFSSGKGSYKDIFANSDSVEFDAETGVLTIPGSACFDLMSGGTVEGLSKITMVLEGQKSYNYTGF